MGQSQKKPVRGDRVKYGNLPVVESRVMSTLANGAIRTEDFKLLQPGEFLVVYPRMSKERINQILYYSYDDARRRYHNGLLSQLEWDIYCHLWPRFNYWLSETDIPWSWLSKQFNKGGYSGAIDSINRVREFWGFGLLPLPQEF